MSHTHYCVVGDVTVDDSAAIAPGVVLQALPGSRIVIGKGVCLAGGVCVQSKSGVLKIGSGVTLGANVLVVGSGSIGSNACISPGSTLMNPQIEDDGLLPPNTLSSEPSTRSSQHFSQNGFSQNGFSPTRYDPSKNGVQLNQTYDSSNGNSNSSALTPPNYDRVYGREQVSELLSTLFPQRQSLNGNQDN